MACRCLLVGLAIGLAGCRALLGIEGAVLEPDAADDRAPCVATGARCAGDDVLRTCTGVGQLPTDEACAWGCTTVGAPHCAQLLPEGGVLESTDLLPDPELRLTTISDPVTVNTDDGSILPGIRDGGPGVKNGIRFESRGGVGVFSFGGLVVTGPVSVIGGLGVALVAGGDITVNGVIDLRGDCVGSHAGPGGRPGGGPGTAAAGATGGGGGRAGGNATSGGGGGGWGGDGGTGGKGNALTGGAPGMRQPVLAMMGGGGGGGGGSYLAGGGTGGEGGGGGGAIQILSNGTVTFGLAAGPGGINAGGCGGKHGAGQSSGGGGGAGGTILVEAPVVRLAAAARLAVNGGGGGAARNDPDGELGRLDAVAAKGGGSTSSIGAGGAGGASGGIAGGGAPDALQNGGGGGGAAGHIRFTTRRGAIAAEAGALVSPSLEEPGATATQGTAVTQ